MESEMDKNTKARERRVGDGDLCNSLTHPTVDIYSPVLIDIGNVDKESLDPVGEALEFFPVTIRLENTVQH